MRNGQRVVAFRTVIGRIATPDNHLHLTRYVAGRPVNPLAHGGFVGYRDTGSPWLGELLAYDAAGAPADPTALSGKIAFAVRANDRMSMSPIWRMLRDGLLPASQLRELEAMEQNDFGRGGLYELTYRIETAAGEVVTGPHRVYRADALPNAWTASRLYTVPSNKNDWINRFWYRLTVAGGDADGLLDCGRLAPGGYRLLIDARDAAGNAASASHPIVIA